MHERVDTIRYRAIEPVAAEQHDRESVAAQRSDEIPPKPTDDLEGE